MAVHRGYSSKGEQVSHGCPGIITDCFWGGIGEMEWYYFWEKRARGGACRGSARSVVLGMVAILC